MFARISTITTKAPVRSSASLQIRSTAGRGYAENGIDMLKKDHRKVFEMLDTIRGRRGADAKTVMNKVTEELSMHSAVEEQVLYPALRALANDSNLADHARDEHHAVKVALDRLEKMMPDNPEWDATFENLYSNLKHHVAEEESKIFPIFTSKVENDTLENMGAVMSSLKSVSPIRPHPNAPDTQPFVSMAGMVAGFMDRIGKLTGMTPNAMPTDAKAADEALQRMKSEKEDKAAMKESKKMGY